MTNKEPNRESIFVEVGKGIKCLSYKYDDVKTVAGYVCYFARPLRQRKSTLNCPYRDKMLFSGPPSGCNPFFIRILDCNVLIAHNEF